VDKKLKETEVKYSELTRSKEKLEISLKASESKKGKSEKLVPANENSPESEITDRETIHRLTNEIAELRTNAWSPKFIVLAYALGGAVGLLLFRYGRRITDFIE